MPKEISRRKFIQATGLVTVGSLLAPSVLAFSPDKPKIKAIAFDGFPIFDSRPIFEGVVELFPKQGAQIVEVWKVKLFDYQWLRATAGQYKNFWDVANDALAFACTQCGVEISMAQKAQIMDKYGQINVWPDVVPALRALKKMDLKLCFLSNMTAEMLNQGIDNSNTKEFFDHVISTDQAKTYKPNPKAYHMGLDILKLKKEEILFVAFAGWDVAGAKWFGYPTYWVNRLKAPMDNLDAQPDGSSNGLADLAGFVGEYNSN